MDILFGSVRGVLILFSIYFILLVFLLNKEIYFWNNTQFDQTTKDSEKSSPYV